MDVKGILADRYEITQQVGAGGMATVYLARDSRHERNVAIKVMHPELTAVLGVERFLTEMRVTASLQHPHILPLFDSGQANGQLFYVMPYVDGETLRARLERDQQLPIVDAIRITREVASALDYAHRHGVVHRDVKPENILLQDGTALVADFGIALAVSNAGGERLTQTGLSLGTPHYMSPEQAAGNRAIDGRTDVYSLGCVLYEMLTGETPFTGPTAQAIIARVLTEPIPPLRTRRNTVSPALEAVVLSSLARLPADRPESPAAFANALRTAAAITGAGSTAVRAVSATDVPEPTRRPWLNGLSVWRSIAAVAVAAAAATGWMAFRNGATSDQLQLARQLTFDGDVVGTAISPDGDWIAYVTDDCLVQDFSCTRTLAVREVDGSQSVAIATWPSLDHDLKWSPNGEMLVFRGSPDSAATSAYLTSRLGGSLRRIRVASTAMGFTPDSRSIVFAAGSEAEGQWLVRYDAASLSVSDSVRLPVGWRFSDLTYNPRNQRIAAVASIHDQFRCVALLTPDGKLLDSMTVVAASRVGWDPSRSALLLFVKGPGVADNLIRIPVSGDRLRSDKEQVVLGQVPTADSPTLSVSRSGRVAVIASPTRFEVQLLRLDDPTHTWHPVTQRTGLLQPSSISPDGASVAAIASDNLSDNIYAFPLGPGAPRPISALKAGHANALWSPDGKRIAALRYTGASPGIVTIDAAGGPERLIVPRSSDAQFTWTGESAITVYRNGGLVTFDTTGAEGDKVAIPDSVALSALVGLGGDPSHGRVAYWSERARGLVVADLHARTFSIVTQQTDRLTPAGWGNDGSIYVSKEGDSSATAADARRDHILRIPAAGGVPVVIANLPARCLTAMVSRDGLRAVCGLVLVKPDVWLADQAGKSGGPPP